MTEFKYLKLTIWKENNFYIELYFRNNVFFFLIVAVYNIPKVYDIRQTFCWGRSVELQHAVVPPTVYKNYSCPIFRVIRYI